MNEFCSIAPDVKLGAGVKLSKFINLYGCAIGDTTKIGACVEIQRGATVGKNCKISSHSFICEGVHIEDGVFIGHGVMFTNDNFPVGIGLLRRQPRRFATDRCRLESHPNLREKRRVHRLQCHHHLRRDHRGAGHCRRRRRGHKGRAGGCRGYGGPGKRTAVNHEILKNG